MKTMCWTHCAEGDPDGGREDVREQWNNDFRDDFADERANERRDARPLDASFAKPGNSNLVVGGTAAPLRALAPPLPFPLSCWRAGRGRRKGSQRRGGDSRSCRRCGHRRRRGHIGVADDDVDLDFNAFAIFISISS